MNLVSIVFGVIFVVQLATAQIQTAGSFYRAGVVEFQTRRSKTNLADETLSNAGEFVKLITSPEAQGLDILVFPEAVLNFPATAVPVPRPSDNVIACGNQRNSDLIQKLSCAAQTANVYLTVQLYMSVNCTEDQLQWNDTRPCAIPQNNTNIYNAAVVFNRDGAVIAVYRKFHLYNEPDIRKPLRPDITTFKTDFGVEFGVFICFDILFDSPANVLVQNGVRNFVSPVLWNSELPYLTALQTQQMWSQRHNVTLLVAGGNLPSEGLTGSGIYSGELGALASRLSDTPLTEILFAEVPKIPGGAYVSPNQAQVFNLKKVTNPSPKNILPGLKIWKESLNNFVTRFLNVSEVNTTFKDRICINKDSDLCCDYDIAITVLPVDSSNVYSYAVAVFNGHRSYGSGGTRRLHTKQMICSVVACTEYGKHETCGLRIPSEWDTQEHIQFDRLNLKASITTEETGRNYTVVMANTLNRQIDPLKPNEFDFVLTTINTDPKQMQVAELGLRRPRADIQTFAIYARNSMQDYIESGSKTIAVSGLLLRVLSVFIMLLNQ